MADAYAACGAVAFRSPWGGFGIPPLGSALHRRVLGVRACPVASELVERFGFRWLPSDDPKPLNDWLARPDQALLDHNEQIATEHFSSASLERTLAAVLRKWGW